MGVAFTRFQTRYFLDKYADLDSSLISYGPCQIPTLGFCVDRFDEIQQFVPKTFYKLVPVIDLNGGLTKLSWDKGRDFSRNAVQKLLSELEAEQTAMYLFWSFFCISSCFLNRFLPSVLSCKESMGKRERPTPLNTVELMRIASSRLGLGPHQTMQISERLYPSSRLPILISSPLYLSAPAF